MYCDSYFNTLTGACDFLALEQFSQHFYFNQTTVLNQQSTDLPQRAEVHQKLYRKNTEKATEFHHRGPHIAKNTYFSPLVPPTFEVSTGHNEQPESETWPYLHIGTSWQPTHKRTTTSGRYKLNHSHSPWPSPATSGSSSRLTKPRTPRTGKSPAACEM